jgi:hypothetical protein
MQNIPRWNTIFTIHTGDGRVVGTYDLANFCLNSHIFQFLNITYEWEIFSLILIGFIFVVKHTIQELCEDDTHRQETSKQLTCVDKLIIAV